MKKKLLLTNLVLGYLLFISNEVFSQINKVVTRDTLVFSAANYVIQPNDKLDDLLQRLPIIVIDKQGKIYAQGDTIRRLLVDGSEFFTDDPLTAARVLRADKVGKIKIYWQLGDQASFTGIEDDVKFKTINVILKTNTK